MAAPAQIETNSVRLPDVYEIPIESRTVSRLYLESGFDLQFCDEDGETAIRIDNPIAVVTETARPLVRGGHADHSIQLGRIIVSGNALRNEKLLEIYFDPGVRFWVDPNPEIEICPVGNRALMILHMPGARMAIWFARRRPVDS